MFFEAQNARVRPTGSARLRRAVPASRRKPAKQTFPRIAMIKRFNPIFRCSPPLKKLAKHGRQSAFSDMAATRNSTLDDPFYLPANKFFPENRRVGLTFDDITLATLYSEVLPRDT